VVMAALQDMASPDFFAGALREGLELGCWRRD